MASDTPIDQEEKSEVLHNDDGTVTVKAAEEVGELPEEAFNLVPFFTQEEGKDTKGKKFLKDLAKQVIDHVHEDWESSEDYRERRRQRFKLITGNLDPKEEPFENCANVHIPVMLERLLRLVSRVYVEVFPERDFVFRAVPSTSEDQDRADILTLHGNWQIRKEIPDFFKQSRRALMEFFANGSAFMISHRDIAGKRNRHEFLHCEEFVMPYIWKTTAVDLSDVPHKTRLLRKYKHELRAMQRSGEYADVERIIKKASDPTFNEGPDLTVRPEVDKAEGRDGTNSSVAPYVLYEYHGWAKFPGQDEERPIVATVEPRTSTVCGLYIREEEDWKDRERFDKEVGELDQYQADQQSHQALVAKEQEVVARLAMPDVMPDEAAMLQQGLAAMPPAMPPTMPSWMKAEGDQPKPIRKVPIEKFSHGCCIENPDGSYGLGIGYLLEEFNKAANIAASQFTDAATLANMATLIMPDSVQMEPGEERLIPGEIHRVRGVSAEQIQNAFKLIEYPPGNQQLMEIVKLMLESADGVSSAPDVLSGEAGKANETYRGIATRVEQATRQLTTLAQNFLEMMSQVLKNNARLNAMFMEDRELMHVIDPQTLEGKPIKVSRAMYLEDCYIVFSADTSFAPKEQKIQKADELIGMITALPPPIAMNVFKPPFIYEAVVRALKARGAHDMVRFLGPRPPDVPPQPPMVPGGPPGLPPPGTSPQGGPPGPPPQMIPPGAGAPPPEAMPQ